VTYPVSEKLRSIAERNHRQGTMKTAGLENDGANSTVVLFGSSLSSTASSVSRLTSVTLAVTDDMRSDAVRRDCVVTDVLSVDIDCSIDHAHGYAMK